MRFSIDLQTILDKLPNITREVDRSALDTIGLRPNIEFLHEKPEFKEVLDAINATKVKPLECMV